MRAKVFDCGSFLVADLHRDRLSRNSNFIFYRGSGLRSWFELSWSNRRKIQRNPLNIRKVVRLGVAKSAVFTPAVRHLQVIICSFTNAVQHKCSWPHLQFSYLHFYKCWLIHLQWHICSLGYQIITTNLQWIICCYTIQLLLEHSQLNSLLFPHLLNYICSSKSWATFAAPHLHFCTNAMIFAQVVYLVLYVWR